MAIPLLAAALIVKDEERHLPGCLEALHALRDLVTEVVVYDTGSSDGTRELARAAGATVMEGYWDGDFSRARNAAVAATSARWVLTVDADERPVADAARLHAVLTAGLRRGSELEAVLVPLVNLNAKGSEEYAEPQLRIFRPDRAHYVGRVHEQVQPRPHRTSAWRVPELSRDIIQVRHRGYTDAGALVRKAQRNLELIDAELERVRAIAEPDPVLLARILYHRGRTLALARQPDLALADLRHLRALDVPVPERVWGGDVLANLLLSMGQMEDATAVVGELREEGVNATYCDWLVARGLLARERYAEALPLLRGIDRLIDSARRALDLGPVVEAHLLAAGRLGEVDEAAACCIRLMAGMGRVEGMGSLLLTLWGARPASWLVELLASANGGHLAAVAAELARCEDPGPEIAALLLEQAAAQPVMSSAAPSS